MYHEIAVHRVILRIAAHGGIDDAAHIALLTEDVVELYAHGGGILCQEALRDLRIPDKLIRIELGGPLSSEAVHTYI